MTTPVCLDDDPTAIIAVEVLGGSRLPANLVMALLFSVVLGGMVLLWLPS